MRAIWLAAVAAVVSGCGTMNVVTQSAASIARGQDCRFVTKEEAAKSGGVPTVNADGTPLANPPPPSTDPNDAIAVRAHIPRAAQPPLTATQQRILMCQYDSDEANQKFPYALFVPSTYDPKKPAPLIVDLHGSGVLPLQQMLFDGTTDLAEQYGYIVVAPMGYNTTAFWGAPRGTGTPIETADVNPKTGKKYLLSELSEIDTMAVLAKIRATYTVDPNRIYLTGHSMGGFGTYYLGAQHPEIWAALAPISGGGLNDSTSDRLKNIPMLVMQGSDDPVVRRSGSRNSVLKMQQLGMQHIYLEFPGKEHEFWIRRGRENLEKVFMFFNLVSKTTNLGPMTAEMAAQPSPNVPAPTAPPAGASRPN